MEARRTSVVILTRVYKIRGTIDLIPGARLTDYMNNSNKFIAVTNAEVLDLEDNRILATPFMDVLVNSIEIIFPAADTA